jgi:hypothetical protein
MECVTMTVLVKKMIRRSRTLQLANEIALRTLRLGA